MTSPYLVWWLEEQERETAAIEARAKRLKRLEIHEASLVDRPACPGAVIAIAKSEGSKMPYTTAEVDEKIRKHLAEIAPHLDYNTALQKHCCDSEVQALYQLYPDQAEEAAAKQEEVRKAAAGYQPGDLAYSRIEKRAAALRIKEPKLTREQAITKVMEQDPKLYERYHEEMRW